MKKNSTKKILALLMLLVLTFCVSLPKVKADSAAIYSVDTSVVLGKDGSGVITQIWDINVTSGTEWYLIQDNMGDMEISELKVSENGKAFTNVGEWDVDRDIEEKTNRCGIVTKSDGYELCWGIGSYGRHKFTVSYKMSNMVKAYDDYDGFNIRFINDEMSSSVEKMHLTISKEGEKFTNDTTKIWAFGFNGEIHVKDGKIVCFNNEEMETSNYCNVMARFNKGVFSPLSTVQGSFNDVIETAFEGSDYDYDLYLENENYGNGGESASSMGSSSEDGDGFLIVLGILLGIFVPVIIIIVLVAAFSSKGGTRGLNGGPVEGLSLSAKEKKELNWNRDVPFEGDLEDTYFALKASDSLKNDGDLIGAFILKWMFNGLITLDETPAKTFLGLGEKMQPSIVMPEVPPYEKMDSDMEKDLFKMMGQASGGDLVLQEKEFYRYTRENYTKMESFFNRCEKSGRATMRSVGDIQTVRKKVFFGLIPSETEVATPKGIDHIKAILGFKKYLEDFTLINERSAKEVSLWDNYMVFASLFGIAETVAKQFKDLYPKYFEDMYSNGYYHNDDFFYNMMIINSLSRAGSGGMSAGRSAADAASSSGGGGGFSSFGGGGGFSGGGSGGGSR